MTEYKTNMEKVLAEGISEETRLDPDRVAELVEILYLGSDEYLFQIMTCILTAMAYRMAGSPKVVSEEVKYHAVRRTFELLLAQLDAGYQRDRRKEEN